MQNKAISIRMPRLSRPLMAFSLAAALLLCGCASAWGQGADKPEAASVQAEGPRPEDVAALADLNERIARIQQETEPRVPEHGAREALVAQATLLIVPRYHVLRPKLTPALSSRWFNSYFETLDPAKIYFLQSDIDEFREYEGALWDNRNNVNVGFAFEVYQRFLVRVRQWALFSIKALDEPQDYSVDESIPLNVKTADLAWCATEAEQKERWRRRVKNTLLADLLRREKEAGEAKAKEGGAPAGRRRDVRLRSKKTIVRSYQFRRNATANDILGYFLNAFLSLCDPHTNYMTPAEKKSFDIHMSNSLQGAGFVLSMVDFYTTIMEIIPGGPAARDGRLKPGDRILAVAQAEDAEPEDIMDMPLDEVVSRIRGPKGTPVFLTIQHQGSSAEQVVKIIRDEVVLKDSEPQSTIHQVPLPDGKSARIAQIYIPSFYCDIEGRAKGKPDYRSTTMDTKRLLEEAMDTGPLDGVILDLRGNGGGYLDEACSLCGLFLPGGPVVQAKMGDEVEVLKDPSDGTTFYDGPLVVLVDKLSASASEITAACLQDRGRALICGDSSTHGKGSVQMPLDLMNIRLVSGNAKLLGQDAEGRPRRPGALKITNGRFYRVNGISTQAIGVTPDIVFPSFLDKMETGESNLPNVLPSDEIPSVRYRRWTALDALKAPLREQAAAYMAANPAFAKYAAEVERYGRLRQRKELPLEIDARRAFRDEEEYCLRQFRHYQPVRAKDEEKREHFKTDDEEDDDGEEDEAKEDVILAATLEVMKVLCSRL